jgi:hypothetical protein
MWTEVERALLRGTSLEVSKINHQLSLEKDLEEAEPQTPRGSLESDLVFVDLNRGT